MRRVSDVSRLHWSEGRRLFSATEEEILSGATSDIYFQKGYDLLCHLGLETTEVVAEVFGRRQGVLCGVEEVKQLLQGHVQELWSLREGDTFAPSEVLLRIHGHYGEFGVFETALLGAMASSSGWSTAARVCREALPGVPIASFGARHVHPAVSSVMDRAAIVGGLDDASTVLGAAICGRTAVGTVPHAVILIAGDTSTIAEAMVQTLPHGQRTVLVDTFHDEAEEAVRLAHAFGPQLDGVRLDTASERGGVTPELVREVRHRLTLEGFPDFKILCSGGLTPDRLRLLHEAGADGFGVGHFVSSAAPIDMTMDIKVVAGRPVAKRGRLPGICENPRLQRVL